MAGAERKYGTIVTNIGTELITQAVMEGAKVTLKTLAVGDGAALSEKAQKISG